MILKIVCFLLGVIIGGGVLYYFKENTFEDEVEDNYSEKKEEKIKRNLEELHSRKNQNLQELSKNTGALEEIQEQLGDKNVELVNKQQELKEILQIHFKDAPLQVELDSIRLAIKVIEEMAQDTQNKISGLLTEPTSKIFQMITNGKYKRLFIDESFNIGVDDGLTFVPADRLSKGTIDQIYFALRMAIATVVCEEELPILLDDAFAMYDEKRLKEVFYWMAKGNRQYLIFTCHKREIELLQQCEIPYRAIQL